MPAGRPIAFIALSGAVICSPALARADNVTQTFAATGAEQSLVVPFGVHSMRVVAIGGSGGGGTNGTGGFGAKVSGTLPVTPGQTFYVRVGGNGVTNQSGGTGVGGFNGGGDAPFIGAGGGGGASDIRTVPSSGTNPLQSRLIIAGGGGGGGASVTQPYSTGGNAGYPDGGSGTNGTDTTASGGGGTQSKGGAAATGGGVAGTPTAGALGIGGNGATGGGGGGGGYYGGGGGRAADPNAGGGGGGSSSVASQVTNVTYASGAGAAPSITASWDLPTFQIADARMPEGNGGTSPMNFTIKLSEPAGPDGVIFDAITHDGTATVADNDYLPINTTNIVIPAGQTTHTLPIVIYGDTKFEDDETFTVTVSNLRGAIAGRLIATGTILNDDTHAPTITSPGDVTTAADTPTPALSFAINDVDTPIADLQVTATSSDLDVVNASGIALGGSGAARTITITPQGSGTTTITLSVSDGSNTTSVTFVVTVLAPGSTADGGASPGSGGSSDDGCNCNLSSAPASGRGAAGLLAAGALALLRRRKKSQRR